MKGINSLQQYEEKLGQANNIIKKFAAENQAITPIVLSDYKLFEDFFNKEKRHTYGNSWIYVTQGAYGIGSEKLGYKYYDGENLCALSLFPKIEQPNVLMLYWVRPLGKDILTIIAALAEEIKQKYGICSYVKKLHPDQFDFLLQHGFKSAKEFPWHSSAHSEDDTYPEIIFDRETTLEAINEATRSSSLGRVKRGIVKIKRENEIEISDNSFKENAWQIVKEYFSEREKMPDKINVSTPFDYCNMIFNNNNPNVDKKILFVNKKPAGLYVIEQSEKFNTISMYCCLALRQCHRYLMDLLKLSIFETTESKYINCGGSEDRGMHYFKNKYQPIMENAMFTATNYSD